MRPIETIRGPVAAGELGIVDYHEHLYFNAPGTLLKRDPDFRLNDVEKSAEELRRWRDAGGRTLVEMSAIDFGRDIHGVLAVCERVPDVHVIAITGFNKPSYCDEHVRAASESDLVGRCVRDIVEGIDGTTARAGLVKAGTDYNRVCTLGARLLRVAAETHRETGVPVITHTEAGTMGPEQASLLEAAGVPPMRICLSHMDRNPDFTVHRTLAQRGVYLGYDCPGKIKYGPDETRVILLRRMFDAGLGDRILLGNDLGRPSYWRSYGGGPGLDFVLTRFVARLRDEGFAQAELDALLIHNPARYLTQSD